MLEDRCLERERKKQGRSNDSCHFPDQHSTIMFQNKNRIFQHKN